MRFFLLLLPLALLAKEITLQFLESKPRGLTRDYYIWRFLDQKITPQEAQRALELTDRVTYKIFFRYADKSQNPNIQKIVRCMRLPAKKLPLADESCLAVGVSGAKLLSLSQKQKEQIFQKLSAFPKIKQKFSPFLAKDPFTASQNNPKQFLRTFFLAGKKYRARFFDHNLSKAFLQKLSKEASFPRFVRYCITENLKKPALSLLLLDPQKLDAQSDFLLAIQAIQQGFGSIALSFLQASYQKSYYRSHKDRALLWMYRLTHKKRYLQKLLHSWDLNFYVLLAHEWIHRPFTNFFIPKLLKGMAQIDLSDPFVCEAMRKRLPPKEHLAYRNTQSLYALAIEKESRYHQHPFILPYESYLSDQNVSQKSLIYALARQESRFVPGSISRSFALGPLQFMPFLAKYTAKKLNYKNFDLDMMFQELIAISFAKDHLHFLTKRLAHPLFIAYAYNGGISYTKRKILPLFQHYDPLLAMELVSYPETKEYGKKVLTNYIIYMRILGKNPKLTPLLRKATLLSRSLDERK